MLAEEASKVDGQNTEQREQFSDEVMQKMMREFESMGDQVTSCWENFV
jgi:hypothetical protein